VWCQRLAQGYETAGYPATGPNPDPHAYLYAAANTQTGTTLRNTLHGLLANHAILSYTEARQEMFGNLDDRGGDVTCVYTGRVVHAGGAIPDSTVMNTEHSWAQSWFTTADASQGAKSDLHHLFPTDSHANSVRGNYPFGHPASSITEVYDPTHPGVLTGSRLGTDAGGRRVFEPRNEHKGNLARALFYFAVRYAEPIEPWQEDVLRCWNALDPPDAAEVARTNGVELLEGTRNPFVDHPEYVERIADF
jgi:endonuclease I